MCGRMEGGAASALSQRPLLRTHLVLGQCFSAAVGVLAVLGNAMPAHAAVGTSLGCALQGHTVLAAAIPFRIDAGIVFVVRRSASDRRPCRRPLLGRPRVRKKRRRLLIPCLCLDCGKQPLPQRVWHDDANGGLVFTGRCDVHDLDGVATAHLCGREQERYLSDAWESMGALLMIMGQREHVPAGVLGATSALLQSSGRREHGCAGLLGAT
eukprot:366130-Chlamydomonas_euryale.AAC.70